MQNALLRNNQEHKYKMGNNRQQICKKDLGLRQIVQQMQIKNAVLMQKKQTSQQGYIKWNVLCQTHEALLSYSSLAKPQMEPCHLLLATTLRETHALTEDGQESKKGDLKSGKHDL